MVKTLANVQDITLALLASHLDLAYKALGTRWDPDLANEAANLARGVATLTGEIRKREAHSRRMVGEMTEDERQALVKAYIAGLTKQRRDEFRKYLEELD